MKILVSVPCFENIVPDTMRSIYRLDKGDHEVDFDFIRGHDCARARNLMAKEAVDGNYDYILMVDGDVVLPKDTLLNLLEHKEPFVMGYYGHRDANNRPWDGRTNICKDDGEVSYTHQYKGSELRRLREKGIYKVKMHGGGLGCALIKVDIFKHIKFPWFDWANYASGYVLSEDLYFCEMCKRHAIPIYVDTRVACDHMFKSFINCDDDISEEE